MRYFWLLVLLIFPIVYGYDYGFENGFSLSHISQDSQPHKLVFGLGYNATKTTELFADLVTENTTVTKKFLMPRGIHDLYFSYDCSSLVNQSYVLLLSGFQDMILVYHDQFSVSHNCSDYGAVIGSQALIPRINMSAEIIGNQLVLNFSNQSLVIVYDYYESTVLYYGNISGDSIKVLVDPGQLVGIRAVEIVNGLIVAELETTVQIPVNITRKLADLVVERITNSLVQVGNIGNITVYSVKVLASNGSYVSDYLIPIMKKNTFINLSMDKEIIVYVDPYNLIEELDETNNVLWAGDSVAPRIISSIDRDSYHNSIVFWYLVQDDDANITVNATTKNNTVFSKNGNYTIEINAADSSGNTAQMVISFMMSIPEKPIYLFVDSDGKISVINGAITTDKCKYYSRLRRRCLVRSAIISTSESKIEIEYVTSITRFRNYSSMIILSYNHFGKQILLPINSLYTQITSFYSLSQFRFGSIRYYAYYYDIITYIYGNGRSFSLGSRSTLGYEFYNGTVESVIIKHK